MSNVHDDTASGAEHPGFLQKLKDKLHIGHHKEPATHTDAAKSATTESALAEPAKPAPAAPVKEEAATSPGGEHHGGVHTFLADLPDKELPTEETKSHLHHVTPEVHSPKPELDSEEVFSHAQQGEHHGGVPTFIVALPDDEIPKEVTKETAEGTSTEKEFYDSKEAPPAGNNEFFDSEEVFSKAQSEGEQHEGVPTFLVALPEQDIQGVEKAKLHHVETPERELNTTTDIVDSEEVFSTPQQGEHHGGVPTFLVALPDEEIPQEVNMGATPAVAGKADDDRDAAPEEFDAEEVFSKAQQGEHHDGVPTFLVALPDEDINESKQKLHHVTPTTEEEGSLSK